MDIPLKNRKGIVIAHAIVDLDQVEKLSAFKWCLSHGYATTASVGLMHRYLLAPPGDLFVDHINGDPLDNRLSNLRCVTRGQNTQNRAKQDNVQFHGVASENGKFRSKVVINGVKHHIGMFRNAEDAARAYDAFLQRYEDKNDVHVFHKRNFEPADYTGVHASPVTRTVAKPRVPKIKTEQVAIDDHTVRLVVFGDYPVLIDAEMYDKVKHVKWCVVMDGKTAYKHVSGGETVSGARKSLLLHRVIMQVTDPKVYIDHVNGNTLDNRLANLRISNARLNGQNKKKSTARTFTSKLIGISAARSGVFRATVTLQHKQIFSNTNRSEMHVARKRDLFLLANPQLTHKKNFDDWTPEMIDEWTIV